MVWNPNDPMERRRRIAWSVATSSCIETRQDPVDVFNRIMKEWDEEDEKSQSVTKESQ
jgi:hypothetical protein